MRHCEKYRLMVNKIRITKVCEDSYQLELDNVSAYLTKDKLNELRDIINGRTES